MKKPKRKLMNILVELFGDEAVKKWNLIYPDQQLTYEEFEAKWTPVAESKARKPAKWCVHCNMPPDKTGYCEHCNSFLFEDTYQ